MCLLNRGHDIPTGQPPRHFVQSLPMVAALLGLAGVLLSLGLLIRVAWELVPPGLDWSRVAADIAPQSQTDAGGRDADTGRRLSPPLSGSVTVELATLAPTLSEKAAISPTATAYSSALPDAFMIENVPIGRQARSLSCELQAASDLAWYYGKPYTWDEIFMLVGYSPEGDPHRGFVGRSLDDQPGNVYPYGYGVYAEPIARALQQIGLSARVHYGETSTWLRSQVANGHPVMIWAVGGMRVAQLQQWRTTDGEVVHGVPYEHTYLVIGYDEQQVWVQDPWDGKRRAYPWEQFLASWDVLGRMAVAVETDRMVEGDGSLR